jgi:hypothetical protein
VLEWAYPPDGTPSPLRLLGFPMDEAAALKKLFIGCVRFFSIAPSVLVSRGQGHWSRQRLDRIIRFCSETHKEALAKDIMLRLREALENFRMTAFELAEADEDALHPHFGPKVAFWYMCVALYPEYVLDNWEGMMTEVGHLIGLVEILGVTFCTPLRHWASGSKRRQLVARLAREISLKIRLHQPFRDQQQRRIFIGADHHEISRWPIQKLTACHSVSCATVLQQLAGQEDAEDPWVDFVLARTWADMILSPRELNRFRASLKSPRKIDGIDICLSDEDIDDDIDNLMTEVENARQPFEKLVVQLGMYFPLLLDIPSGKSPPLRLSRQLSPATFEVLSNTTEDLTNSRKRGQSFSSLAKRNTDGRIGFLIVFRTSPNLVQATEPRYYAEVTGYCIPITLSEATRYEVLRNMEVNGKGRDFDAPSSRLSGNANQSRVLRHAIMSDVADQRLENADQDFAFASIQEELPRFWHTAQFNGECGHNAWTKSAEAVRRQW